MTCYQAQFEIEAAKTRTGTNAEIKFDGLLVWIALPGSEGVHQGIVLDLAEEMQRATTPQEFVMAVKDNMVALPSGN